VAGCTTDWAVVSSDFIAIVCAVATNLNEAVIHLRKVVPTIDHFGKSRRSSPAIESRDHHELWPFNERAAMFVAPGGIDSWYYLSISWPICHNV
jgi:hypothetical protein